MRVHPNDGSEMVYVPAGPFTMGANDGEADERPAHQVTLGAYWIGRIPVTNQQFATFLNQEGNGRERSGLRWFNGRAEPPYDIYMVGTRFVVRKSRERYPAVGVTWNGARAYCRWAGLRLPTEAEWEKAARGVDGRIYPWGNAWEPGRANAVAQGLLELNDLKHLGYTSVESFPRGVSPYGALDMVGNVWNWCSSIYATYPYHDDDGRESLKINAERVLRGGSWYLSPDYSRASNRYRKFPSYPEMPWFLATVGFRVALPAEGEPVRDIASASTSNLRRRAHPPQLPMFTGNEVRPSVADDERYRLRGTSYPTDTLLGYPVTPEREARYAVPHERLEEMLWKGRARLVFPEQVLDALHLRAGSTVGEIGAGSGYFTSRIAAAIGPTGNLWSTDISVASLRFLQKRLHLTPKCAKVHLVLHDLTDCLLPERSLDVALVAQTQYFYYPRATKEASPSLKQVVGFYHSIWRALKPGGRLIIMDKDVRNRLQFPGRSGITYQEIVDQMEAAGFSHQKVHQIETVNRNGHVFRVRDLLVFKRKG